ncbi:uncharacterized protein J3R85_001183 [Psidium guajava]|nr:uncharacterized protein J3R85_001183 [Psidium guajava]
MDVSNAFLQGTLQDEVFMEQPPGFKDPAKPDHVCKLRKAIYGLKQAPRAWYNELSAFLKANSFTHSMADSSLFIYSHNGMEAYFLVYVDDLVITGNNTRFLNDFVARLSTRFSVKDLGTLDYFLGIEVLHTKKGLLLLQHKYIRDLLRKHKMAEAKDVRSPMATGATLSLHDNSRYTTATDFRSLVGALQYLLITRPDISFAINKLS